MLLRVGMRTPTLYLQHRLGEVSVEESNHFLHIGAALGPHCDHVSIPKPEQKHRLCVLRSYFKKDRRDLSSPVLQVLDAAQTFEPAVHHDAQPGAQCLTLLHAAKHINMFFK